MAKKRQPPQKERSHTVERLTRGELTVFLLGTTALFYNRLSTRAKMALLWGSVRKSQAELAQNLKHDVICEFRESVYLCRDKKAPTLLHTPFGALKGALRTSAKDTKGIFGTTVGRLIRIVDETVFVYGIPKLDMRAVKPPGQAPDIRTRAILPEWAFHHQLRQAHIQRTWNPQPACQCR